MDRSKQNSGGVHPAPEDNAATGHVTIILPPGKRITSRALLERAARVERILGKYAWIPTSSEEFLKRKHEELDCEV